MFFEHYLFILKTMTEEERKKIISEHYSKIGKKGKGKSKVRGDAEYYRNMVRIREEKKKKTQ